MQIAPITSVALLLGLAILGGPVVQGQEAVLSTVREQWAKEFIERLNRERERAGVDGVSINQGLSRGCAAHAHYLVRNVDPQSTNAQVIYSESPANDAYSVEGERTAKSALVALAKPLPALERWMGRLFSRVSLLNPDIDCIGLAFEHNAQGVWFCVLDMANGIRDMKVVYPAPDQVDVALAFSSGPEVANSKAVGKAVTGFPVSVTFEPAKRIAGAKLEMYDAGGKRVEGRVWTPDRRLDGGTRLNIVALLPNDVLRPNTTYHAKASAEVDGAPWKLEWSFVTESATDRERKLANEVLRTLNAFRLKAGLSPVELHDSLSAGCHAHAQYLLLNRLAALAQGIQNEDPQLPGYSAEGHAAGKGSQITLDDADPSANLEARMATFYHRLPLLEPTLTTIGFGCAPGERGRLVTVLNVGTGRGKAAPTPPVCYPAANQVDVPLRFNPRGEEPSPLPDAKLGETGYPITVFFSAGEPFTAASAQLTDASGREVPCWLSTPEKPGNPRFALLQGNSACLIAKTPLAPNRLHHVHIKGLLGSVAWEKRWSFTTAATEDSNVTSKEHVLARINHYRARAGLGHVALDAERGDACQLHAEYLLENGEAIRTSNASANEEDPLLPGYTADGARVATQADVCIDAPSALTHIEEMMASFTRRTVLLDPQLKRVGWGGGLDPAKRWSSVIDCAGYQSEVRYILYPAPQQDAVPCVGFDSLGLPAGKEAGMPVSISFPNHIVLTDVHATLVDGREGKVECHLSTPEKPLNRKLQRSTIGIHPLVPLRPGREHTVTVSARVNGVAWRQVWHFSTKPSTP